MYLHWWAIHSSLIHGLSQLVILKNKIRVNLYRGSNGQKPLDTMILETRGQKYLDGDSKRSMKADFSWAPVCVCRFFGCLSMFICHIVYRKQKLYSNVYFTLYFKIEASGSNFSLCIVMERNNTVSDIENLNKPVSGDFVHHRWDLNRWPAPFCRHFNRYATQGLYIFFVIG